MEMRKCTNPNEKGKRPYARAVSGGPDPLVCGWPPGQPLFTDELLAVVSVLPMRNMKTAFGSP